MDCMNLVPHKQCARYESASRKIVCGGIRKTPDGKIHTTNDVGIPLSGCNIDDKGTYDHDKALEICNGFKP